MKSIISRVTDIRRAFAILSVVLIPCICFGHAGHDHGPAVGENAGAGGPITLAEETIKNLEIRTVEAKLVPLQRSVTMAARIAVLPEKHALISARFDGRVGEILVKLGDPVKAGQTLLKGEPLTVGSPPVLLKSPIDGQLTRQAATLGQSFTAETVLMEVSDHRTIYAKGMTYEGLEMTNIKIGQRATVKINVLPEPVFTGTLASVDVGLEEDSKTFEVYALLENPDLLLRPNMQATLTVGIGPLQEVLAVPRRAILGDLGNHFVFVQDGNSFERRSVVLGLRSGDLVELLEGVLPTDLVVTQGNYQLQYATSIAKPAVGAATSQGAEKSAHTPVERIKQIASDRRVHISVAALIGLLVIIRIIMGISRKAKAQSSRPPATSDKEQ